MRAEPRDKDALRITDQFRGSRGMVYDLRCQGSRLTVCIAERTNPFDPGQWRVEAWTGQHADAEVDLQVGDHPGGRADRSGQVLGRERDGAGAAQLRLGVGGEGARGGPGDLRRGAESRP